MPEALKPCPFCGGDAEFCGNTQHQMFWVLCKRCHASPGDKRNRAEAITAWNTRPTDPEIARLQDLVAKFQRGGVSTLFADGNVDG